jgi:autotransporter-associated beta strand protein
LVLVDSSLAKNGVLTLGGACAYNGATVVSNGTLLVNGSISTGATTVKGGTLGGTGTIGGSLDVNSGATLAPGSAGSGALTVSGNLTLNAGSTNTFAVDGTTPANVAVTAGAGVTYGGLLKIVPTGTFTNGQSFTLFSGAGAASASNFSSLQGSAGSGLGFTFTNGVLSVVTAGPSGPAMITNSISGGVLSLAWPAGQGWRLQMQTNSLTTGLGTNWTYITDGSLNSTNITIDPSKPTVFYRLTYP